MKQSKPWKLWKIEGEFKQDNRRMLRIRCPECGRVIAIRKTKYRDYRSCGRCRFVIQNRRNLGKHRGVGDLTRTYYNYFRNTARRRDIPFTVSIEYLWELAEKQDMKCALTGLPVVFPTIQNGSGNWTLDANAQQRMRTGAGRIEVASLDRIDSSKGYAEGNVQWVNKWVNLMKNGLSQEEFIHLCHLVASQHANPEPSRLNGFSFGRGGVRRKVQRLTGEEPNPISQTRAPGVPPSQEEDDDIVPSSGETRRAIA